MSSNVLKFNNTGTGLMQFDADVPLSLSYRLVSVTCNFNAAPVSAENFTITLDANAGAPYDLLLYTLDPGTSSTSDILWQPDEEILLEGNDQIEVRYDNTDARLYGLQVTMKVV
jgi:hypothetical protein